MKASTLPADVARCDGVSFIEDGVTYWREGCEECLRRTAKRPKRVSMIEPEPVIAFLCRFFIEPEGKAESK